jgi:photosystem II stability/assembly factor-like uncharacterized protein
MVLLEVPYSVYRNGERIVAVHQNKTVYETAVKPVYWRTVSVLPKEIDMKSFRRIELSDAGDIYVLTDTDLYVLWKDNTEWERLTDDTLPEEKFGFRDLAVGPNDEIVIPTRGPYLNVSTDGGITWRSIHLGIYTETGNYDPVQFSASGKLYLSTTSGLVVSEDLGVSSKKLGSRDMADFIVIDDSTIFGLDDYWGYDAGVYKYDSARDTWKLIWRANADQLRFNILDDGTWVISIVENMDERVILSSTDQGESWRERRFFPSHDYFIERPISFGYFHHFPHIVGGDSESVLLYSVMAQQMYEVMLTEDTTYLRNEPIARAYADIILANKETMLLYGPWEMYHIRRADDFIFPRSWLSNGMEHNYRIAGNSFVYNLSNQFMNQHNATGQLRISFDYINNEYTDTPCWFNSFVLTSSDELIGVNEYIGVLRMNYFCDLNLARLISDFPAKLISISNNQHYLAATTTGAFELFDAHDLRLAVGALTPFYDDIIAVQNDSRGNLVFLGEHTAYHSGDYGASWQHSSIDNGNTALKKIIVDHKDAFYLLDQEGGVFWSHDGGASFLPLPLDFDSLDCTLSDITIDGHDLFAATTGCGVYRRPLPSLLRIDTPTASGTNFEPINLSVQGRDILRIELPFEAADATMLHLTDINGSTLHQVVYTVDSRRNALNVHLRSLADGVYPFIVRSGKNSVHGKLMIRK